MQFAYLSALRWIRSVQNVSDSFEHRGWNSLIVCQSTLYTNCEDWPKNNSRAYHLHGKHNLRRTIQLDSKELIQYLCLDILSEYSNMHATRSTSSIQDLNCFRHSSLKNRLKLNMVVLTRLILNGCFCLFFSYAFQVSNG